MAITRSAATYVSMVVEYNVAMLWSVYHCYAWSCMFIAICFLPIIVNINWFLCMVMHSYAVYTAQTTERVL